MKGWRGVFIYKKKNREKKKKREGKKMECDTDIKLGCLYASS